MIAISVDIDDPEVKALDLADLPPAVDAEIKRLIGDGWKHISVDLKRLADPWVWTVEPLSRSMPPRETVRA